MISTAFADIFYNNCFKNGILPITVSPEDLDKLMDDAERGANATLTVDLESQEIRGPDGGMVKFEIDAFRKHCLLNGLDDIGLTLEKKARRSTATRPGWPSAPGPDPPASAHELAGPAPRPGPCFESNLRTGPPLTRVLPEVVTFWRGPLDRLRQTCLRSQLAAGHKVTVYSFDPLPGLPDGVGNAEAEAILPYAFSERSAAAARRLLARLDHAAVQRLLPHAADGEPRRALARRRRAAAAPGRDSTRLCPLSPGSGRGSSATPFCTCRRTIPSSRRSTG